MRLARLNTSPHEVGWAVPLSRRFPRIIDALELEQVEAMRFELTTKEFLCRYRSRSSGARNALSRRRVLGRFEQLEPRCVLAAESIVAAVSPPMGATYVGTADDFTVEFGQSMDPATINAATIELRDPFGHLVPATVTYGAEAKTATLDPALDLPVIADYFTVTVKGGKRASSPTLATHWPVISSGRLVQVGRFFKKRLPSRASFIPRS